MLKLLHLESMRKFKFYTIFDFMQLKVICEQIYMIHDLSLLHKEFNVKRKQEIHESNTNPFLAKLAQRDMTLSLTRLSSSDQMSGNRSRKGSPDKTSGYLDKRITQCQNITSKISFTSALRDELDIK